MGKNKGRMCDSIHDDFAVHPLTKQKASFYDFIENN